MIIGERFGRLVVVEITDKKRSGNKVLRCACDCGGERLSILSLLRRGKVASCGCLGLEERAERYRTRAESSLPRRFWSKVQKTDGCWLWAGDKDREGYGRFWVTAAGRSLRSHRVAYELSKGQIPAGLLIMHNCDNPSCVRPDHLSVGNVQANVTDRVIKGRGATGQKNGAHAKPERVRRGELNGRHVLSDDDVRRIRSMSGDGVSLSRIAASFRISKSQASNVVRGAQWKHVA